MVEAVAKHRLHEGQSLLQVDIVLTAERQVWTTNVNGWFSKFVASSPTPTRYGIRPSQNLHSLKTNLSFVMFSSLAYRLIQLFPSQKNYGGLKLSNSFTVIVSHCLKPSAFLRELLLGHCKTTPVRSPNRQPARSQTSFLGPAPLQTGLLVSVATKHHDEPMLH